MLLMQSVAAAALVDFYAEHIVKAPLIAEEREALTKVIFGIKHKGVNRKKLLAKLEYKIRALDCDVFKNQTNGSLIIIAKTKACQFSLDGEMVYIALGWLESCNYLVDMLWRDAVDCNLRKKYLELIMYHTLTEYGSRIYPTKAARYATRQLSVEAVDSFRFIDYSNMRDVIISFWCQGNPRDANKQESWKYIRAKLIQYIARSQIYPMIISRMNIMHVVMLVNDEEFFTQILNFPYAPMMLDERDGYGRYPVDYLCMQRSRKLKICKELCLDGCDGSPYYQCKRMIEQELTEKFTFVIGELTIDSVVAACQEREITLPDYVMSMLSINSMISNFEFYAARTAISLCRELDDNNNDRERYPRALLEIAEYTCIDDKPYDKEHLTHGSVMLY